MKVSKSWVDVGEEVKFLVEKMRAMDEEETFEFWDEDLYEIVKRPQYWKTDN